MLGRLPNLGIAVGLISSFEQIHFWALPPHPYYRSFYPKFVRIALNICSITAIVFAYDYHPLSKTLAETHFGPNPRYPNPTRQHQPTGPIVPEQVLWSYIVQVASALKVIHSAGLAARVIEPSKILLTSKMR